MKSNYVFVLDTEKVPQNPVHPAAARRLLKQGQAAVYRTQPFTIILKSKGPGPLFVKPLRLKLDPGSKTTGMALLDGPRVLWVAELEHRGKAIKSALDKRRVVRRSRRNRHTRYRAPRFDNRTRPKGWLPPSLIHRVLTTMTWVKRLCDYAPVACISVENVRFDMQLIMNPEIEGVEYQQGELKGYELREYLLEKFRRTCVYCRKKDRPLEVEHIVPRTRGGTRRTSNLVISCKPCNKRKDDRTAAEFGHPEVQAWALMPLRDAAAVNATRWRIWNELTATGLPVEAGSGGRTKFNRSRQHLPKTHWLDAACVGASTPDKLIFKTEQPLLIKSRGHGRRRLINVDKSGFPRSKARRYKRPFGFSARDIVRIRPVRTKKYRGGVYRGFVGAIDTKGGPGNLVKTRCGKEIKDRPATIELIRHSDGYSYTWGKSLGVIKMAEGGSR